MSNPMSLLQGVRILCGRNCIQTQVLFAAISPLLLVVYMENRLASFLQFYSMISNSELLIQTAFRPSQIHSVKSPLRPFSH